MRFRSLFKRGRPPSAQSAFTLIELLVVIAIIAILAVVVILTLNPQEQIKQARDSNRLSDLATLTKALSLYQSDYGGTLGNASTVYVSVPAVNSNCSDLGLPALPAGWSYACASTSTYRKIDGTGWIPVNFQNVSFGSPLGTLPVDPINTTTTQNYYTYVIGGTGNNQYEVSTLLESQRYQAQEAQSGSPDMASYTVGSNLNIASFTHGLIGWWKFDEGSGTATVDATGINSTNFVQNTVTYSWTTGKIGSAINWTPTCSLNCGTTNSYVQVTWATSTAFQNGTFAVWVYATSTLPGTVFRSTVDAMGMDMEGGTSQVWFGQVYSNGACNSGKGFLLTPNAWTFLAATYDGTTIRCYVNGNLVDSGNPANPVSNVSPRFNIATRNDAYAQYFHGTIDDLRIYNRTLSTAEIQGIYNATK